MSELKASNALGGKTARACDSCVLRRARWFCAADDAFLCQACDASVHSANQLASRHERVRLETASFKVRGVDSFRPEGNWHTRKARSPRQTKSSRVQPPLPLVPEINAEDPFPEENEEQLLYRVPVFDPFADELNVIEGELLEADDGHRGVGNMVLDDGEEACCLDLNLEELLSSCDEEFAADVEGLLVEDDGKREVKIEVEEEDDDDDDDEVQAVIACHFDPALDMELNWDFSHYESSMTGELDLENVTDIINKTSNMQSGISESSQVNKRMLLRLNYEAVIASWATQGSPWTNGVRPYQFNLDEFMVACLGSVSGSLGGFSGRSGVSDAEREARVSRYREKRRTRLFSKKIRYQVRKLNADKRPRMKGRFVKRPGPSFPYMTS